MTTILTVTDALLKGHVENTVKDFAIRTIAPNKSINKNDPFEDAEFGTLSFIGTDQYDDNILQIRWKKSPREEKTLVIQRQDNFIIRRCVFKDPAGPGIGSKMAKGMTKVMKRLFKKERPDEQLIPLLTSDEQPLAAYEMLVQSDKYDGKGIRSAARWIFQIQTETAEEFEKAIKDFFDDHINLGYNDEEIAEKKSFTNLKTSDKKVDYWCTGTTFNRFQDKSHYKARRVKTETENDLSANYLKFFHKNKRTTPGADVGDVVLAAGKLMPAMISGGDGVDFDADFDGCDGCI